MNAMGTVTGGMFGPFRTMMGWSALHLLRPARARLPQPRALPRASDAEDRLSMLRAGPPGQHHPAGPLANRTQLADRYTRLRRMGAL
jgi:hypothetical protein